MTAAQWTIRTKLYGAFGALLALMTAACLVSIWSAVAVRNQQTRVQQATERLQRASDLKAMNSEIFAAEKNMIISGMIQDRENLQRWTDQMVALVKTGTARAGELRNLVDDNGEKEIVAQLKGGMQEWNSRCDACHQVAGDLTRKGKEVAQLSAQGEALMLANFRLADRIKTAQTRLVADETAQSDRVATRSYMLGLVALGLALGVGVLVFVAVRGIGTNLTSMATELRETAEHLFGAATELSGSADSLSHGSMEQAGALQETSASMSQVSAMTRENGDHSREAARLTADADQAVQRSNAALGETERTMASLVQSSNRVSQIISTIDEIAFQTNILALNAAIEAARAGESGAGFAVVADEVRLLAQRCAEAARDTAALVDASIVSCGEANQTVGGVAMAMQQVTANVAAVRELAGKVSTASSQQSEGIDTVSEALARIEKLTQSTAATAEETAATSSQLSVQADRSRELVWRLEQMVLGHNGHHRSAPAPAPVRRRALAVAAH